MTRFNLTRRDWMISAFATLFSFRHGPASASDGKTYVKRIPYQYIATLAPADATSGTGAETWGLWRRDPGPIGVWVSQFQRLLDLNGVGPSGWKFDIDDWWLDENGLIMTAPEFPITPGQYYVTNGEHHISLLTIEEPDAKGRMGWSLSDDKTIGNVTHGPCRSARYTPKGDSASCSPENVNRSVFPLRPGESPPPVGGCNKQDYAVLIVFAVPVT